MNISFSDINFEFVPCNVDEKAEMIDESAYDSTVKIKEEPDDNNFNCIVKEEYADTLLENAIIIKSEEDCYDTRKVKRQEDLSDLKKKDNKSILVANSNFTINVQEKTMPVCNNQNLYNYVFEIPKIFQCQRCKSKIIGQDYYMTHVFFCGS